MLIPVAHENLRGRRWPYVTIAIIVLNFLVFFFTIGPMNREQARIGTAQLHILLFNARFPDAEMTPEALHMVSAFKSEHAPVYAELASKDRDVFDSWDAQQLSTDWSPADAQSEMNELCAQFDQARKNSIMWNFAFHPYHPTPWSYITANFLHAGWLHIIFNMWFFWLAGTILEDAWGRLVYPIFYLICGVAALICHAIIYPGSMVPVVGASGAIAGMMGAFLARFPRTKIKLMWIWFFGLTRYKFYVPAYIILPLWLGIQLFWGMMAGSSSGVAYWAHVGGFALGMVGAVILRATGIEHKMDEAIEAKVSWTPDPHLASATEWLGENKPDFAIAELQQQLKDHPDSGDALELLLKAQEKLQDFGGMKETLANLCRHYVAVNDAPAALSHYEQYVNLGGERLPRGVWLQICRYFEAEHDWERAATEYQKYAEANAQERSAVPALVSAAQIYLKQLNRRDKAESMLLAAQSSPVPHLDSEAAIQEGLKQCGAALPKTGVYSG
jgi:membrane associated rhomboid family serine protease